jgi:hypothetical protein
MTKSDRDLRRATHELRTDVRELEVPSFRPSRRVAPALVAAVVLAFVIGVGAWALPSRTDDAGLTVATQPETQQLDDEPAQPTLDPTAVTVAPDPAPVEDDPQLATAEVQLGRLSNAAAGEFYLPLPSSQAWNADESQVLLYRTGEADPAHVVLDSATGTVVSVVDLDPPDIEQIYWHPTDPNRLVAFEGNTLVSFAVDTGQRVVVHEFADCVKVDAGFPSPPATTGQLTGLCQTADGLAAVVLDLDNGLQARETVATTSSSIHISPTGQWIVLTREQAPALVFDGLLVEQETELDLGGNVFGFGSTRDGVEHVAATLFDPPFIGSVVLLPLDGSTPRVVVGPDQGYEYPPSGAEISVVNNRIVFSTRGPVDGELAGRVSFVDLDRPGDELVSTLLHGSTGEHDYWSKPFVSLSPSGRFAVYSTDSGADRVDTWVAEFPP